MLSGCLVVLLVVVTLVYGSGRLSMRMVTFHNPGGKGHNGNCCDGFSFLCHSPCDHQFTICLDRIGGSPALNHCRYGRVVTGEVRDRDSFTFGTSIGGTRNPIVFPMSALPSYLRIKVGIWDTDTGNAYDYVDYIAGNVELVPGQNEASASSARTTLRRRVTLNMIIKSYCDNGYFGPNCAVFCQDHALGHYTCDSKTGDKICDAGWKGLNCDSSVDDCASNPCLNNGLCIDRHRGYICECPDGFKGDDCELRIDPCLSDPCYNGGSCTDTGTSYTCSCQKGWTGARCLEDINECHYSPCFNFDFCVNYPGDFRCQCLDGFTGKFCEVNTDECLSSPCQNDGTCRDLLNSFHCECPFGYTGAICDHMVDHCSSDPCQNNATCTNWIGGYHCACAPGYTGLTCKRELDQCESNPCFNNASCVNLRTTFTCVCLNGFTGPTCAVEVDECSSFPCQNNATCIDGVANVTCQCMEGFTGHLCETNIDDCFSSPCMNNATCFDGISDVTCECMEDFTGHLCETNIDDCFSSPCMNNATCSDGISDVTCECMEGFTGHLCESDIDDCFPDACLNNGTCVDHTGYFACSCDEYTTGPFCEILITSVTVTEPSSPATTSEHSEAVLTTFTPVGWTDGPMSTFGSESSSLSQTEPFDQSTTSETTPTTTDQNQTSTSVYDINSLTPEVITPAGGPCFPQLFKGKIGQPEQKDLNNQIGAMLRASGEIHDHLTVKSEFHYFKDKKGRPVTEVSVNVTVGGKLLQKDDLADICRRIPAGNFLQNFPYQMYHGTLFPLSRSSRHSTEKTKSTTVAVIVATVSVAAAVVCLIVYIIYRRNRAEKSPSSEAMSFDESASQFENQLYMQPSLAGIDNSGIPLE